MHRGLGQTESEVLGSTRTDLTNSNVSPGFMESLRDRMSRVPSAIWGISALVAIAGTAAGVIKANGGNFNFKGFKPGFSSSLNGLVAANALNDESQSIFNKFNVQPFFIKERAYSDWKPYTDQYREKHLTNNGKPLTWDEVESLKRTATLMAYNNSGVSLQAAKNILNAEVSAGKPARKITDIVGELLNKELDNLLRDSGYSNISKDMRGIMELRAASGWTRRYTSYLMLPGRRAQGVASRPVSTQKILQEENPPVICTDSAVIARDITRKISTISGSGLKSYFVEGSLFFPGEVRTGQGLGHAWVGGILASGMKMPSDPTPNALEDQKRANWNNAVSSFRDCPTDPVSAELFMASYCDQNDNDVWIRNAQRIARGGKDFPLREGIDVRQGDKQNIVNLGNNRSDATQHWKRWLEQDQPYRDKLVPLHNWYNNQ